jgi:FlaG/FlaF family flagellin (archaellin)
MKQVRRKTTGISETVAVLFMILVAVFFAGLVAIFLLGSTQRQTATPDFVFDASLISVTPTSCRLSVTVKNTGSVPIDSVTVTLTSGGSGSLSVAGPLPPGRSASNSGTVSCPSPGNSVVIEAVAVSGQNAVRKAARVVVQ